MSCPSGARLAAAASREDAEAAAHASRCPRCAQILEEQRATIGLLSRAPAPPLPERSRAELAAEILARADAAPPRRPLWSAGIVAVAAATTAILIGPRDASSPPAPVGPEPAHTMVAEVAPAAAPTHDSPAPVAPPPRVAATLPVRTRPASPKRSAEVQGSADRKPVAVADPKPLPGADPKAPAADPKAVSVAAFRSGWEALGAGRNTDAILAFDRATDPVVAEDAAFWAAVAADRAGDRQAAARRFRDFLARFPQSPHSEAARAGLFAVTK